ncbi:hypothetical protein [Salinarchaeum laminariae]|uniref:hypothetical protein n=1 Tax=Salinarchaeum laminariae TaxID=869888 RepID=UPI0020BD8E94|nr:hypothetical protein [Salinarchaeum laminariae]
MTRDRPTARYHDDASSDRQNDGGAGSGGTDLSRRRMLGAAGAAAAAGLAGCSGILGGGGDGDGGSSGSSPDNVQNEVNGIEVTDATADASGGQYSITVNLRNTGGEETSVLDFAYDVTLYDESGSEIQTMGSAAANRDGFYNGDTGTVEIMPQLEAEASAVDRFELTVRCDEGPYCE